MSLLNRIRTYPRQHRGDSRGWLLKLLDGSETGLPSAVGECYTVLGHPGAVRGGHYHPIANEWFTVVQGRATLLLADPSSGERASMELSGESPVTVHVPAGVAHAFQVKEMMLLFSYADRRYDAADTVLWDISEQR